MTEAAGIVAAARPGFRPKVGVILGSGLGPMAEDVTDASVLDYRDLPGFPRPSVEGHAGRLSLGKIGETPVAVLQGRLQALPVAQAGAFVYLEPFVTVVLAAAILDEPLLLASLIGGGTILLGVWLVNRTEKSEG